MLSPSRYAFTPSVRAPGYNGSRWVVDVSGRAARNFLVAAPIHSIRPRPLGCSPTGAVGTGAGGPGGSATGGAGGWATGGEGGAGGAGGAATTDPDAPGGTGCSTVAGCGGTTGTRCLGGARGTC